MVCFLTDHVWSFIMTVSVRLDVELLTTRLDQMVHRTWKYLFLFILEEHKFDVSINVFQFALCMTVQRFMSIG